MRDIEKDLEPCEKCPFIAEINAKSAQLADTQAALAEAVGALELFKFPGVIGSDLPDDYTFAAEIKAVNFKRVEQLLQSPAAKAAGERVRALEAVVEAAREDSEGVKGQ